ncbi:MAG: ATPase, T2SS/T4P/T4SS family [Deltaproteobacteria bacterium]|nr:ATPase, T2SS/T4P/T4SS family [Deltaproteobacteria bacterium]
MDGEVRIEVRRGFELVAEHTFPFGKEILVGRAVDADVRLDSQEISRRHLSIAADEGGLVVRDLSRNGVLVDGAPPEGTVHRAAFGARVEAGPFVIVASKPADASAGPGLPEIRKSALKSLIADVDLALLDPRRKGGETLRPRVEAALERALHRQAPPSGTDLAGLVAELADEALGLGPLERLLADDTVSEIMVVDPGTVFVERRGLLAREPASFTSEEAVRTVIERIITPLGRRIDESSPMVDARLPDGSRVNAVIPPLAIRGPCITIRKFAKKPLAIDDLIRFGSLNRAMADFLMRAVAARRNIVISGGTGSGKTTLLNVLSGAIPAGERIVTVEDAAELRLPQPHVVPLESRPANAEGRGAVTIRDLVRNALRMRPDRIVVGECRGGEALDMLQAMNTGHDGSLTTTHANSPAEAVSRIETLCLMAGVDLPARAIREQIAAAVDVIVQQSRFADGARRVTSICEVSGLADDGRVRLAEVFRHRNVPGGPGEFLATGFLPSFAADLAAIGLAPESLP